MEQERPLILNFSVVTSPTSKTRLSECSDLGRRLSRTQNDLCLWDPHGPSRRSLAGPYQETLC